MIDVGSEWRTFTNEKATKDPSRVGDAQNPLLNGGDLTTMISKVKRKPQFCPRFQGLGHVHVKIKHRLKCKKFLTQAL